MLGKTNKVDENGYEKATEAAARARAF